MKTSKPVLISGIVLLFISLACQTLQPALPTATPISESTATVIPSTEAPEPTMTAETLTTGSYPSRIAYSFFSQNRGVFIHTVDADGQNDVPLTASDCLGALPAWSTDGNRIAYHCYNPDTGKSDLWVMSADGSGASFISELPGLIEIQWSPDDAQLMYFAPQSDGMENDIYVLDIASGETVNLTKDSPVWDAFPDWSPDGAQIAFVSDRAENGKSLDDIWVMNADGSGLVNLTNNGEDWEDDHPTWSPDGKQIAFFRTSSLFSQMAEGGPAGLWVMDADGQNPRLVTAIDGFRPSGRAAWSPDGQYLAYPFGLLDEEQVWVVPVAGGEPVNVSNLPGQKSSISWSPDSKALIFTNDYDTDDTLLIYIALPDGSDTHPLLDHERFGFGDWAP